MKASWQAVSGTPRVEEPTIFVQQVELMLSTTLKLPLLIEVIVFCKVQNMNPDMDKH